MEQNQPNKIKIKTEASSDPIVSLNNPRPVRADNEHQNGYRIMCCIIDVCPRYLKKMLVQEISKNRDSYNNKIKQKISENKIYGACYIQRLQDSLTIKENDKSVKNFCFSLCLIVLEQILEFRNRSLECIVELRKIRDVMHGHALKIGLSNKEEPVSNELFEKLRDTIISNLAFLIPADGGSIKQEIDEICNRVIINNETKYIDEIKSQFYAEIGQKISKDGQLPNGKVLNAENFNEYMIALQHSNQLKELFLILQNERLDEQNRRFEEIVKIFGKTVGLTADEPIQTASIKEINELLKNNLEVSNYYFILILVGLEDNISTDLLNVLKNIASFGCWNLIMNFHHDSFKIYDAVKPKNRNFETLLLNEIEHHNLNLNIDHLLKHVCYFLKCNGCSENSIDMYEDISEYMREFENLLIKIFKNSSSTMNFFTITLIGDSKLNEIKDQNFKIDKLHTSINVILREVKKKINSSKPMKNYVLSFSNEESTRECFTDLNNLKLTTDVSCKLLLENLGKNGGQDDLSSYYVPAKSGDKCQIDEETIIKYKSHLVIYHLDFGNKECDIETKDKDSSEEELKDNFLKGESLIPKVLWINENADCNQKRIFIERTLEKKVIEVFYKDNRPGEIWNKPDEYFKITHARSAGGNTLSRSILFKLRKYFICLELTQLQDQKTIIDYLTSLKQTYRNNLIIMVHQDTLKGFSWTENDLSAFQRTLANRVDKNCKILYVCRGNKIIKSDIFENFKAELSTTLDENEKNSLTSIYPKDLNSESKYPFQSNKIHLYPLYYFNEEFERIDQIIDACFETIKCEKEHDIFCKKQQCSNCKLKLILFLMSTVEKLSNCNLNKESIASLISKENANALIDNAFKYNDNKSLSFLTEVAVLKDNKWVKLAHSCLGNRILNKLACFTNKNPIHKFGELVLELVKEQKSNREFKQILVDLLIKNKQVVSPEYKTEKCSNSSCPKKEICENYHYKHERRRFNSKNYKVLRCHKVFQGTWNDPDQCPRGDECLYCHTENEYDYHPSVSNYLENENTVLGFSTFFTNVNSGKFTLVN